jgi:hypothetical protein
LIPSSPDSVTATLRGLAVYPERSHASVFSSAVAHLVLVRPMLRMLTVTGLTVVSLASCAPFPNVYDASGDRARLQWSEIAQIKRLIAARADILKPISEISLVDADNAEVRSN